VKRLGEVATIIREADVARRKLTDKEYAEILKSNANACCVCRRQGIGVNIHHIDHDATNNSHENLGVLCVQEHDAHHRPDQYPALNHLGLSPDEITRYKREWEEFVAEARKPDPGVLATVNVYGSFEHIHAARLLLQWVDGRVAIDRHYHLLEGPPDEWIDHLLEEVKWLGDGIKLALVDEPLAIEYCSCCGRSLPNIINPDRARMLTAKDWAERSTCSVYINPHRHSLAIHMAYDRDGVADAAFHKCGRHLHLSACNFDERTPIKRKPSIRTQATSIVRSFISAWNPGRVFIGTGDQDEPNLIDSLTLPICWE
jgi:hypothetical protein